MREPLIYHLSDFKPKGRLMSDAKRGRNIGRAFLEDRAKFVRTETVRLSRIAGGGALLLDLLLRGVILGAVLRAYADRSDQPPMGGS
jgi:hypothetical protein